MKKSLSKVILMVLIFVMVFGMLGPLTAIGQSYEEENYAEVEKDAEIVELDVEIGTEDNGDAEDVFTKKEENTTEEIVHDASCDDETTNDTEIEEDKGAEIPIVHEPSELQTTANDTTYDVYELFVIRLYNTALNRNYDRTGFNFWSNSLRSGQRTAADVAFGFFFSTEMQRRNLNNANYVDALYRALLGRAPDASGRTFWISRLDGGTPRANVFAGFINSAEFRRIKTQAGIPHGTFTPPQVTPPQQPTPQQPAPPQQSTQRHVFVARLYRYILGREGSANEINGWVNSMSNGNSGANVIRGFAFSTEAQRRNLTDSQWTQAIERAVWNRGPTIAINGSMSRVLTNGQSRQDALNIVLRHSEFTAIRNRYNLPTATINNTTITNRLNEFRRSHPSGSAYGRPTAGRDCVTFANMIQNVAFPDMPTRQVAIIRNGVAIDTSVIRLGDRLRFARAGQAGHVGIVVSTNPLRIVHANVVTNGVGRVRWDDAVTAVSGGYRIQGGATTWTQITIETRWP